MIASMEKGVRVTVVVGDAARLIFESDRTRMMIEAGKVPELRAKEAIDK
jgi:hypothetical protein